MECPVCLDTIADIEVGLLQKKYQTPCCSQNIHKKCLVKCLLYKDVCPLCREKLKLIRNGFIHCTPTRLRMFFILYSIILTIVLLSFDLRFIIMYMCISTGILCAVGITSVILRCVRGKITVVHIQNSN